MQITHRAQRVKVVSLSYLEVNSPVPRPHYSARPIRLGSRAPSEEVMAFPARSPRIRHRSELTEKAWENAVQGLSKEVNANVVFRTLGGLNG